MSEKDDPLYRNRMAAGAQEPFKPTGWLVELHTRRASPLLNDPGPLTDEIAVVVKVRKHLDERASAASGRV